MSSSNRESELEAEKKIEFLGTARVALRWLHFTDGFINLKHVRKLQSIFRKDCQRIDVHNHVPAVIDQQYLARALREANISANVLLKTVVKDLPNLDFWPGFQLECLHGKHRIKAAKDVLLLSDAWWIVDFYSSNLSTELRTTLIEEYANESRPSDGEVYIKIRKYYALRQFDLEARWWSRLSTTKTKNLKQLLKHCDIAAAFDSLAETPALLEAMRLGSMHKILAIRCDEEILHYLCHIKNFWFNLLQHDKESMKKLDATTINTLQLMAPWASLIDAETIEKKISAGEIFGSFEWQARTNIWNRLRIFKGLIPSLYTFFEDVKVLEAWIDCLRWIFPAASRQMMSTTLNDMYIDADQQKTTTLVEVAERTFVSVPAESSYQRDLACRQLYVFAMRHYRAIPRKLSGRDVLAKPAAVAEVTKLGDLGDLARVLGFQSPGISTLRGHPKTAALETTTSNARPLLVTAGQSLAKIDRCGLPRVQDYRENQRYFYLPYLHDTRNEQADTITSFFRLRCMYHNFFGQLSEEISRSLRCQDLPEVEDYTMGTNIAQAILDNEEKQPNVDVCKETIEARQRRQEQSRQKFAQEGEQLRNLEQAQESKRQKLIVEEQRLNALDESCNVDRERIAQNKNMLKKQQQQQVLDKRALTVAFTELVAQKERQKREEEALEAHECQLEARKKQQQNRQVELEAFADHLLETEQILHNKERDLLDIDQRILEQEQNRDDLQRKDSKTLIELDLSNDNRLHESLNEERSSLHDETAEDTGGESSTPTVGYKGPQFRADETSQAEPVGGADDREIRCSPQRRKREESEEGADYQRRGRKPVGWKFQRLN